MRSGFVAIIGRPNAGKSTLLNALVGEKLSIVSPKPQTTRHRVLGIVNLAREGDRPPGQIVFVDTPGLHKPLNSLNRKMMREVNDALEGLDLLLAMVDVSTKYSGPDAMLLEMVRRARSSAEGKKPPVFLLLNKVDLIAKPKLLPLIGQYSGAYPFAEIIPISAAKRDGLGTLLDLIVRRLPQGAAHFPADQITDQPERVLAAELIRERVLKVTSEEVPHAVTVLVEEWKAERELLRIAAAIFCERPGQRAILLGKQGQTLKRIGSEARREIEARLGSKVFLELFVKVQEHWRESRQFVEELDWRKQIENLTPRE